jgi:hypothetical protein
VRIWTDEDSDGRVPDAFRKDVPKDTSHPSPPEVLCTAILP